MAAYPYSCQTGRYTVDQIDGEACAECGEWFQIGEDTVPTGVTVDGAPLFRHEQCPTGGAR